MQVWIVVENGFDGVNETHNIERVFATEAAAHQNAKDRNSIEQERCGVYATNDIKVEGPFTVEGE
jgi:hypothetical protein